MTQTQLAGIKKAAILMVLLGDEASAGVLGCMQEDEVQEISKEISRLGEINSDTADGVLEEFYKLTLAQTFLARGGPEFAKKLLVKAFGSDSSKKLLDYLNISLQSTLVGFDSLQKADPVQLSKFIQSEQPQTIGAGRRSTAAWGHSSAVTFSPNGWRPCRASAAGSARRASRHAASDRPARRAGEIRPPIQVDKYTRCGSR